MFKKGDLVVAVNNIQNIIEKNKIYQILDIEEDKKYQILQSDETISITIIYLKLNNNNYGWYDVSNFITELEYRKLKINKIQWNIKMKINTMSV